MIKAISLRAFDALPFPEEESLDPRPSTQYPRNHYVFKDAPCGCEYYVKWHVSDIPQYNSKTAWLKPCNQH